MAQSGYPFFGKSVLLRFDMARLSSCPRCWGDEWMGPDVDGDVLGGEGEGEGGGGGRRVLRRKDLDGDDRDR
jgi:hypothetical protein